MPPLESPRRNLTGAIVPALAAAALAGLGAMYLVSRQPPAAQVSAAPEGCILEHAEALGGPIELRDMHGATVTQADFAGQPVVVYFGFTHCPDVCPMTMYTLNEALALPEGYDVQPVLISVDPARDTPEVLGAYVATDGFPTGLVGLTGSEAQVEAATQAFRVAAARGETSGSGYNVNHSTFLYVLDGAWRTVAVIPTFRAEPLADGRPGPMTPIPAADMAACISAGLDRAGAATAG